MSDDPIWMLPAVAAYGASVRVDTVRKWARRGKVRRSDDGLYDWRDIVAWIESGRDGHRARIAESRYRCDIGRRYGDTPTPIVAECTSGA